MRSDLALTPSEGVGIGERYFPEKPKIVPRVIRQGKIPTGGSGRGYPSGGDPEHLTQGVKPHSPFPNVKTLWYVRRICVGLIYNHEDFSEFRYYCSQLNTITVCDDSAELEPPGWLLARGVFSSAWI